jgi:hypothetical protein
MMNALKTIIFTPEGHDECPKTIIFTPNGQEGVRGNLGSPY